MSTLSGYLSNPKSLSQIVSVNSDNVTTSNLTVTGDITNPAIQTAETNITNLQNVTQNQTASPNITTFSGEVVGSDASFNRLWGTLQTASQPNISSIGSLTSLTVSGHVVAPDASLSAYINVAGLNITSGKGSQSLTNCFTVGTELTDASTGFPIFSFSSDTQNGFTTTASTNNGVAYRAWGTAGGTYWASSASYSPSGSASSSYYLNYTGGTSYGEYVSLACPSDYIVTSCSFYNSYGANLNQTFKSVSLFGQYKSDTPFLLGSYTCGGNPPSQTTYSFSFSNTQPANSFYFQITQMSNWSGGGINLSCAVTQILLYGTSWNQSISQSVYIPQSLEVGRSTTPSIPSSALTINGATLMNGTLTVENLSLNGCITAYTSPYVTPVSGQIGYTWQFPFTTQTIVSGTLKLVTNLTIGIGTWIMFCRIGIHNTTSNFCNLTSVQLYLTDSGGVVYDNFMDNGTTHAITASAHFTPQITAIIQYISGRAYGVYLNVTHNGTSSNVIYGDDSGSQLWVVRIA